MSKDDSFGVSLVGESNAGISESLQSNDGITQVNNNIIIGR